MIGKNKKIRTFASQIKNIGYRNGKPASDTKESYKETMQQVENNLDNIGGPGFCLAKWLQVTIHLANGTNHSCHHPRVHAIDPEEIKTNPSALHNTAYKKQQRKEMMEGGRPDECDYCWRVEDANADSSIEDKNFSDRIIKSASPWAISRIEEVMKHGWEGDITPSYVEVDFENTCNFKCAYCSPSYSSQWQKEIRDHGPYVLPFIRFNDPAETAKHSKLPIKPDGNPYIEAFWKWFPEASKEMTDFRITGGEPLLSKNTFKVLDYLEKNPNRELNFAINSNLGVDTDVVDNYIERINKLQHDRCIRSCTVYTSNEAYGKQAEYIRYGMDYELWERNLRTFVGNTRAKVVIMSTINNLSFSSYQKFLETVLDIKLKYTTRSRHLCLALDFPYLRHPEFLAGWVATPELLTPMKEALHWARLNHEQGDGAGFYVFETERMNRAIKLFEKKMIEDEADLNSRDIKRASFYQFVNEYDRRRKTNFLQTFPDYSEFYDLCKTASERFITVGR